MDKFYVGQRVRIKSDAHTKYPQYLGRICTVVAPPHRDPQGDKRYPLDFCRDDGVQANVKEYRLAPVDDGDSFERFMERVTKPIPVDRPVTA